MANNQTKRQKWLKIARPTIMALVLVTVLTYVSYSWIKREWTPNIKQEGIKIVAGDSLTFIFEDENGSNVEIDSQGKTVNELLGMTDFTLKSVSNFSGESNDFFRLQYSTKGEKYALFDHLSRIEDAGNYIDDDVAYREMGKANGYIEMKFTVQVPETASASVVKGIFLHEDSLLANGANTNLDSLGGVNPILALRMSVTVHEYYPEGYTVRDKTVIFAADERAGVLHEAVTNELTQGDKYLADGGTMYTWINGVPTDERNAELIKTGDNLLKLSERMPASGTPLFTMTGGESKEITVRIWLEGEDPDCLNAISGQEIDLMLKFCARTVEAVAADETP